MSSLNSILERVAKRWSWIGVLVFVWLFIALAVLLCVIQIYSFLGVPPHKDLEHRIQSDQAAYYQPRNTEPDIRSSETDDQTNNIKPNNESYSNRLEKLMKHWDLKAQEGMWAAAFSLVVITILQFFASLVGLYLILTTYREARNATNAANRTAEAAESAERAHLLIDFELDPIKNADGKRLLSAKVVNAGKTPAINVSTAYGWRLDRKVCLGEMGPPIAILPTGKDEDVEVASFDKTDSLPVTLDVFITEYEDIFGGKHGGVKGTATINEKFELTTRIDLPDTKDKNKNK